MNTYKYKMKIALLNLPFDANYGGNLQRYALISVLNRFGHDTVHLNIVCHNELPWYKKTLSYSKRFLFILLGKDTVPVFYEHKKEIAALERNRSALLFYDKYIPHTSEIVNKSQLSQVKNMHFDAYLVGSDQVWRKSMTNQIGIRNYFFKFIDGLKVKKIAYSVSLGIAQNELSDKEVKDLSKLYQQFTSVSVRERSALILLQSYHWNNPKAEHVLDPTFLLLKSDYIQLINKEFTIQNEKKMFCYILDKTDETDAIVNEISRQKQMLPYYINYNELGGLDSIEQWLRNFMDAEFIVTDSYHGTVFSLIFNKPFRTIENARRGNARLESLFCTLGISADMTIFDWTNINYKIEQERRKSLDFLKRSLIV